MTYYSGFISGILESNENQAIPPVIDFIFTVDTTNVGSASDNYDMPLTNGVTYNFTVHWGDGNTDVVNSSATTGISHVYASGGEYDIKIEGAAPEIIFGGSSDSAKVVALKDWGDGTWDNVANMFNGCVNFTGYSAIDPPVFSASVTSFENMFNGCVGMAANISNWTTTGVTNMTHMFDGCVLFDSELGSWDVSSVTDFSYMFNGNSVFTSDLSTWVTTAAIDMKFMFKDASLFSSAINTWTTSGVVSMEQMFRNATSFYSNLSSWNTAFVTNMDYMFSNVALTNNNYGVNGWNVSSLLSAVGFMEDHNMSISTYNSVLNGWGPDSINSNVTVDFGTSVYDGLALTNRFKMTDTFNWTVIDGGIQTMTMIAGGSSTDNGYRSGSWGSIAPTTIGGYSVADVSWEDEKFGPFPVVRTDVFLLRTNGGAPSNYWSRIEFQHSSGSPSWTVTIGQVAYTQVVNANEILQMVENQQAFVVGETYYVNIIK